MFKFIKRQFVRLLNIIKQLWTDVLFNMIYEDEDEYFTKTGKIIYSIIMSIFLSLITIIIIFTSPLMLIILKDSGDKDDF